jgi:hypothetical protein
VSVYVSPPSTPTRRVPLSYTTRWLESSANTSTQPWKPKIEELANVVVVVTYGALDAVPERKTSARLTIE